jgi:hypothetical protein
MALAFYSEPSSDINLSRADSCVLMMDFQSRPEAAIASSHGTTQVAQERHPVAPPQAAGDAYDPMSGAASRRTTRSTERARAAFLAEALAALDPQQRDAQWLSRSAQG